MDWGNELDNINWRHIKQHSVTCSDEWLIRAIEQKNPHLSVGVAYSELLVYDQLDRQLITLSSDSLNN